MSSPKSTCNFRERLAGAQYSTFENYDNRYYSIPQDLSYSGFDVSGSIQASPSPVYRDYIPSHSTFHSPLQSDNNCDHHFSDLSKQVEYSCRDFSNFRTTNPTIAYKTKTDTIQSNIDRKKNGGSKKERRRTQSINNAFMALRECIPNVPCDTKLSKIKTLRLATSYIDYLMKLLNTEYPEAPETFKADINKKWKEKSEEEKRLELVCL